jgi:hypothetical protein
MAQGPNSLAPMYFSTAAEIFQWQPGSASVVEFKTGIIALLLLLSMGLTIWFLFRPL